jgi:hypothetical protein
MDAAAGGGEERVNGEVESPGGGERTGRRCTATSKRTGERCKRAAAPGRSVCAMHGGKSPSGPAHPAFRHGRYSAALPARLGDRYRAALGDPELLALRDELALVDARLDELLRRVGAGVHGAAWREAVAALADLRRALATGPPAAVRLALHDLGAALDAGAAEGQVWAEIGAQLDRRVRLAEAERRRLLDTRAVLSAEEAMALLAALAEVVVETVDDPAALARINEAIRRLAEGQGPLAPRLLRFPRRGDTAHDSHAARGH